MAYATDGDRTDVRRRATPTDGESPPRTVGRDT